MKFIQIILENSTVTESKLYDPSKKASVNPHTGITIQNRSAYHVIKDCATIAYRYIPIFVFGQYPDPFKALNGKFKRSDIEEFISSANSNFVHEQLLSLILSKIETDGYVHKEEDTNTTTNFTVNEKDPYGEYGMSSEQPAPAPIKASNSTLDILCEAFNAV
jgi:hypothetical protein